MRWLGVLLAGMLSGCALLPSAPAPAMRPAQPESAPFSLNGRIAVKYNGARHSAGLRWVHTAQSDEILLLAPLGQTAARVYRDAQIERNRNGQIAVLRQDGWEVHYQRYPDSKPDSLPMRLQLDHEGLQVQLLIDEWELQIGRA